MTLVLEGQAVRVTGESDVDGVAVVHARGERDDTIAVVAATHDEVLAVTADRGLADRVRAANGNVWPTGLLDNSWTEPARTGCPTVPSYSLGSPHLERLRKDWDTWLRKNEEIVGAIRSPGEHDSQRMGASDIDSVIGPLLHAADHLGV